MDNPSARDLFVPSPRAIQLGENSLAFSDAGSSTDSVSPTTTKHNLSQQACQNINACARKTKTSVEYTDNEDFIRSKTTEILCSSFSSDHNRVSPRGKPSRARGGMNPFDSDFPRHFPQVEAISEHDDNEIDTRFHPHHRFPNPPANKRTERLSKAQPDNEDTVNAHKPAVPHTLETRTTGAERLIRRNCSRGRGRNGNFADANTQSPPHQNAFIRMENRRQSGTGARKSHSRHCHLCNKKTSSEMPHARLCTRPGCRKAICLRCSSEVYGNGKIVDAANFECPHCLNVCGEIANRNVQCFAYNAETERRRMQNRQRRGEAKGRLPQVQPLRADNPADRSTPPRPSRRSADLLRENDVVPPLAAEQGPDPAPIQNANHPSVGVAPQFACPHLNLLPPQVPRAEVLDFATFLDSQPAIEHVTMHASTADANSWDPIFDA